MQTTATTTTATARKIKLYEFVLEKYNELNGEMLEKGLCNLYMLLMNRNIITYGQYEFLKGQMENFMAAKKIELGDKWPERSLTCWEQFDTASRIEYLENKIAQLKGN